MAFENDALAHIRHVREGFSQLMASTTREVKRSVVEGSEITGAAGQPVDTGHLRASYHDEFESPTEWVLGTNADYAEEIENNERGAQLRSEVGGFHSIAKTRSGWQDIVDHCNAEVQR